MKRNVKVSGIVITGVLISVLLPNLITNSISKSLSKETIESSRVAQTQGDIVQTEEKRDTAVPVTVEPEVAEEAAPEAETVQEVKKEEKIKQEDTGTPVAFDNMTIDELAEKLNRSLKSTLTGTGMSFAKHSAELGVDPYLAVAIVLHETGCNGTCSSAVVNKNNVGGMRAGGRLLSFESLDAGIAAYMSNLKRLYFDQGYTTAETMQPKYAPGSPDWVQKVNYYIEKIKAA